MNTSSRRLSGFTLVELLVVITIIGILMGLLIPAVGAVRARARQATCLNNMKEVGKAIVNFETNKGRYPGYVQSVKRANNRFVVVSNPSMGGAIFENSNPFTPAQEGRAKLASQIAWSAMILPQLDNLSLWDIIVDPNASAAQSKVIPLAIYVCPDDNEILNSPENAGLSYSANAGAWDFSSPSPGSYINKALTPEPNRGDTADNGLFHNLVWGKVAARSSHIRDGSATTLLLAENMNKNQNYSWLGVSGSGQQMGEQHFGFNWVVNTRPPGTSATNIEDQARMSYDVPSADSADPSSDTVPFYARPGSVHSGGTINVIFADGHGRTISPDMDYIVYQQLMTPNGGDCEDPTGHVGPIPPGSHPVIEEFRSAAPVSEKDIE